MKIITCLIGFLMTFNAYATNFYFAASGNDANPGTQAAPWKTITKLNSFFVSLRPGDSVLFKRGDSFTGSIVCTMDGTASQRIYIGAYGTGNKPVITGGYTVPAWTSLGGNIWESTTAVSTLTSVNMVTVNGVNTPMGRFPNAGYLAYTTPVSNTTITCTGLNGTNWTGAELVSKRYRWMIEKVTITAQSGSTINFVNNGNGQTPQNNYGCFVTNDVRTLDQQNEWYYNPATKKIRIYSTAQPVNVIVTTVDKLVDCRAKDYLSFDNLSFRFANKYGVSCENAESPFFTNCEFLNMGWMAIFTREDNAGASANGIKIENCTIRDCNDAGLYLGNSSNAIVRSNTIDNIGLFPGMGKPAVTNFSGSTFEGITENGSGCTIEYNKLDSVGYIGIKWRAQSSIQYNVINYTNCVKDDGGGIYCNPANLGNTHATKGYCRYNIVTNTVGAAAGTNSNTPEGHGIYNDEACDNIDYIGNTVINSASYGMFMNQNNRSNITSNTVFDAPRCFVLQKYTTGLPFDGNNVTGNLFVAKTSTQYAQYYEPMTLSTMSGFTISNNIIARPIDQAGNWCWWDFGGINYYGTLGDWKGESGKDVGSISSPITIDNVNKFRVEYNATQTPSVTNLGATYTGMDGTVYSGNLTLQPYTSKILLFTSSVGNASPTVNAGANQTITLPTSSLTLIGTGADSDGSIASWSWTKLSGPTAGTIVNPFNATTSVTGLTAGTYIFRLSVTDNLGAVATDDVQVVVNAAPVTPVRKFTITIFSDYSIQVN